MLHGISQYGSFHEFLLDYKPSKLSPTPLREYEPSCASIATS